MIPEDLRYSPDHEWVRAEGKKGRVGITDHAQEAMGSIVFIELPQVGARVAPGESIGFVESVKAASDYYSPVSGVVAAVNEELLESPGLINEDPYGRGWIAEIDLDDPLELDRLLDAAGYGELLAGEGK